MKPILFGKNKSKKPKPEEIDYPEIIDEDLAEIEEELQKGYIPGETIC